MRSSWSSDRIVVTAVLVISFLITLLDFAGVLEHVPWLSERIPVMTLLSISLIGTSFYVDGSRLNEAVNEAARASQADLIAAIGANGDGIELVQRLHRRWAARDTEIHRALKEAMRAADHGELHSMLSGMQEKLVKGEFIGGARARFPWDVTLMAMDYSGRVIYHPNEAIVDTRPNLPHHSRILREKSGSCQWVNKFVTQQLRDALGLQAGTDYEVDRFTKVYFRECRKARAICVFESHLDVLYQLPSQG